MFARHPELKNLFNQTHQKTGSQPETLAKAVYAYAANIDNLGALGGAVIAHKHASLNIRPSITRSSARTCSRRSSKCWATR